MGKRIRVGVVGCGRWCKNYHLPILTDTMSDLYEVVGVCDAMDALAAEVAGLTGAPAYARVEDLIDGADPELVYVVTKPPTTHHAVGRVALQAGRHLFVEKPMCETAAECDELIALAREHRRVLAVHHNRRWEVPFLVAQDVVRKRTLGEPYYVLSNHASSWCGPADLLVDWGIHIADQALRIGAPSQPVEVSCLVRNPSDAGNSGPWRASVRFASGLVVDLFQMLVPAGALPRWLVSGHEGSCAINPPYDMHNQTDQLRIEITEITGGREFGDKAPVTVSLDLTHYHELLHRTIAEGAPPAVAPEQARNAVALSNLLVEAAGRQQAVRVDPDQWIDEPDSLM